MAMPWAAAAIAFCLCGLRTVQAGLAVSPMQQWVAAQPGGRASFVLTLNHVQRSGAAHPITVALETVGFAVSPDGTISFGPEQTHGRSAISWIRLDAAEVTLKAGETRSIQGEVAVPYEADGDYWAAVMISQRAPSAAKGVNVQLRTASGVFVRVERRNYLVRPDIRDVQLILPALGTVQVGGEPGTPGAAETALERGCLQVLAGVGNPGVLSFVASGKASVYSADRRKVATIPMHSRRRRVLPGDLRQFAGVLSAPLPAGDYSMRIQVDADARAARPAYHEVTFSVSEDLARRWKEWQMTAAVALPQVEPAEVRLDLSPGRSTGVLVTVKNTVNATAHVCCRFVGDTVPDGWISFATDEYTLGPLMQRSVYCRLDVPRDTAEGPYTGTISVEVEAAGLCGQEASRTAHVPVLVTVR
jgi:hypothetical protein